MIPSLDQWQEAAEWADQIDDEEIRARCLSTFYQKLVDALNTQYNNIRTKVLQSIKDTYWQTRALIHLAEIQQKTGSPDKTQKPWNDIGSQINNKSKLLKTQARVELWCFVAQAHYNCKQNKDGVLALAHAHEHILKSRGNEKTEATYKFVEILVKLNMWEKAKEYIPSLPSLDEQDKAWAIVRKDYLHRGNLPAAQQLINDISTPTGKAEAHYDLVHRRRNKIRNRKIPARFPVGTNTFSQRANSESFFCGAVLRYCISRARSMASGLRSYKAARSNQ